MKTQPTNVNTHPANKRVGILAALITTLICFSVAPKAWSQNLFWAGNAANPVVGGDGFWVLPLPSEPISWSTTPTTETAAVWTDDSVAHFVGTTAGTVTLESNITAGGINFDPGANSYNINTNAFILTVTGAGLVNTSGKTQTITNIVDGGDTEFTGASSAGNATINNAGAGATIFSGTSNAGTATITNSSAFLTFMNASSAGNATIINTNTDSTTFFRDTSTAASATIVNNEASFTQFLNSSTAGSATIINNGSLTIGGGETDFLDTSTAGGASIISTGNGVVQFMGNSSAGNATIFSSGAPVFGSLAGTYFSNNADGGTARAITNGGDSFDISGLTSAGMKIGSIEGSGNYFLGSKTLTVGGNNLSTTVSGSIQDGGTDGGTGGSLTKVGAGTLTLTGTNTYSGGTSINSGILAVNSDLNLGTGALSFNGGTLEVLTGGGINSGKAITLNAGGGTLLTDAGTTSTFGGAISGVGSLTKAGVGTLILAGVNTYTGSTTISAGTLQAGSATGLSPNSAFTVNSTLDLHGFNNTIGSLSGAGTVLNNGATVAALTVGGNNASTSYTGTLENGTSALQLTKSGTGTFTLTGTNTYTGGTTISAGTLQVGNGGATGSIVGNVADNAILAFDRSDSFTFGGVISGKGNLVQQGTGTVILSALNTYTGVTTVNAGSLIVDGSTASVQTLVNTGALLGGRGSLGGNLVSSGVVSPGDSPGTLTVAGNYTQNAAGTLHIEVAGLGASQHDLLAVNGRASLAGTLQLISLGGFTLHVGDQLTFLTASGGVSGSFGTIQNELNTGTIVKAQVVTLANSVVVEGTQGSFVQAACNPNSAAVAQALNNAVGNPRAAALIAFLNGQPMNNLCGEFTLIGPEALASIFNAGVSLANTQTANLKRRMADIRSGSNGFSAAGFELNGGVLSFSGGLAGETGPEGKSGPSVMAPTPENRWGVWVTGTGEFANVSGTAQAAGYDIQTGGVTFGVDYRVCPIFAIGLTAGYANINGDLPNGGNLDINSGELGLYATLFGGGFYADAAVSGGPSGYDTRRTALLGSANGSTDGGDLNALIAVGYDWKKGGLSIGPTANFQFSYVDVSGFTESGSMAPLKFDNQNAESERTALGMKASYEWKVGHIIIKPEFSAAWQHEFGDQSYSVVSSFANGAGSSFTVASPQIGRDSLLIGAGATVLLSERVSIYAFYDGELLRTNYQSNSVTAGVRMTF